MPKYSVLIAEFPYGNSTHPDVADWITQLVVALREDPRIGDSGVHRTRIADTPITMSRNRVLVAAEQKGIDFVLMVDSDMRLDIGFTADGRLIDPTAKRFFPTAFEHALQSPVPTIIGAPYCGPPPHENVYVFKWANFQSEHPGPDFAIAQYERDEAARLTGIQPVAALPTGLMLIDMRGMARLAHPRFYYEDKDATYSEKASTEDVTFSRDCGAAGIRVLCNWDAWAGHHKTKCVGKPTFVDPQHVNDKIYEGMDFYHRLRGLREQAAVNGQPGEPDALCSGLVNRSPTAVTPPIGAFVFQQQPPGA